MLENITDIYKAFLDGIKKESTTTVTPERFNRIINTAQLIWQNVNVKSVEMQQLDIDRFRMLLTTSELDPSIVDSSKFELGEDYMRMLSVMFRINWNDDACESGVSDYLPAYYLRTDKRSVSKINPYRKATQNRIYYRQIGNDIEFIKNAHGEPVSCSVEYIRYAMDMKFVGINSNDNIECEMPLHTRQEIVDLAVRIHLERVIDPRYQTYLNEYVINNNLK